MEDSYQLPLRVALMCSSELKVRGCCGPAQQEPMVAGFIDLRMHLGNLLPPPLPPFRQPESLTLVGQVQICEVCTSISLLEDPKNLSWSVWGGKGMYYFPRFLTTFSVWGFNI